MAPRRKPKTPPALPDEVERRVREAADAFAAALRAQLASAGRVAEDTSAYNEGLPEGDRTGNLGPMLPAARVRHSKGASKGRKRDELALVASHAGHTIRSLAEELGCSHVFLLAARRGDKAIRRTWAETIQRLTRSEKHPAGFAATPANWSGGWARED